VSVQTRLSSSASSSISPASPLGRSTGRSTRTLRTRVDSSKIGPRRFLKRTSSESSRDCADPASPLLQSGWRHLLCSVSQRCRRRLRSCHRPHLLLPCRRRHCRRHRRLRRRMMSSIFYLTTRQSLTTRQNQRRWQSRRRASHHLLPPQRQYTSLWMTATSHQDQQRCR